MWYHRFAFVLSFQDNHLRDYIKTIDEVNDLLYIRTTLSVVTVSVSDYGLTISISVTSATFRIGATATVFNIIVIRGPVGTHFGTARWPTSVQKAVPFTAGGGTTQPCRLDGHIPTRRRKVPVKVRYEIA